MSSQNRTPYQPSIITHLRNLMPDRPLGFAEGLTVAELQAARLLEFSQVTEPAVPNLVIADLPRVHVTYRDNLPMSGFAQWESGRWTIAVNRSESPLRQRFSLAHEFKHVLDHATIAHAYPATNTATSEEIAERVCDYFAACLLMPKAWVKSSYCYEGVQDIASLARRFAVSPAAMRYRLTQLGLIEPVQRHRRYQRALPQMSALSLSMLGVAA